MLYIEKFGFKSGMVALFLFSIYGFIVNSFIGITYGFNAKLPEDIMSAATGPISIITFTLFMLVGFIFVAITTRLGNRRVDLQDKKNYLARFTIRIIEVTFVMALSIIGTLLGMGFSSQFFYIVGYVESSLYLIQYALATMIFAVIYPFMIFAISFFDYDKLYKYKINFISLIYIFFIAIFFAISDLYYDFIAYSSSVIAIFIVIQMIRNNIKFRA